jgi:hypothetical protein
MLAECPLFGRDADIAGCRLMVHFGHSVGRAFGPVVLPDGPYAFRATDIPRRKTEIDQCVPLIVLARGVLSGVYGLTGL